MGGSEKMTIFAGRLEFLAMRRSEILTIINANNLPTAKQHTPGQLQASLLGSRLTAALAKSNNSLAHSL